MCEITEETIKVFRTAVAKLNEAVECDKLSDGNAESQLREWLDGNAQPLSWTYPDRITSDEWFFVTTLYGEMNMAGQRTHIRKYFLPLFVQAAQRDIRNFVPDMAEYAGLRSGWMTKRLCRMGSILRQRSLTMSEYTQKLRDIELTATPENPMPALDQIIRDHSATGWKTLSVFVRDCVQGNCFPIDSRVKKALVENKLPVDELDEQHLVSLALAIGGNPRQIARIFYSAGG